MTVTQFIFLLYREVLKFSVSPSEPMTGNSPRNAGDIGSIPRLGTRIPRTTEQLRWRATTTEPVRHNESLCCSERPRMPQLPRQQKEGRKERGESKVLKFNVTIK